MENLLFRTRCAPIPGSEPVLIGCSNLPWLSGGPQKLCLGSGEAMLSSPAWSSSLGLVLLGQDYRIESWL